MSGPRTKHFISRSAKATGDKYAGRAAIPISKVSNQKFAPGPPVYANWPINTILRVPCRIWKNVCTLSIDQLKCQDDVGRPGDLHRRLFWFSDQPAARRSS